MLYSLRLDEANADAKEVSRVLLSILGCLSPLWPPVDLSVPN